MPHIPPVTGPKSTKQAHPMYYQRFTGLGPANYPDPAQAIWDFQGRKTTIRFISGTGPVTFSLNGVDDHGVVGGTGGPVEVELEAVTRSIWFKGGSTAVVDVSSEPF